jgi:hypothetical protein
VRQQDGYQTPSGGDTVLVSDNLAFRVGLGRRSRGPRVADGRARIPRRRDHPRLPIDVGTVTVETETTGACGATQVSIFLVHLAPGRRPPP